MYFWKLIVFNGNVMVLSPQGSYQRAKHLAFSISYTWAGLTFLFIFYSFHFFDTKKFFIYSIESSELNWFASAQAQAQAQAQIKLG